MVKFLLALHLLTAIFAIGPLVHAASTAARGVRHGDAAATASSARVVRIYSYASLLVVVIGFALMGLKEDGVVEGKFSQPWIWLSVLLWAVAVGVVLAVLVPALERAGEQITAGQPVRALVGRVAATGGLTALIFAVIVFLMVYKPGR